DMPLRAFVLFSAAAGIFGWPGQANYASANAFLDALAHLRHAQGLPAVSTAWGMWAEARGMGGRLETANRARAVRTAAPMTAEQGLALFDLACAGDEALVVPFRLDAAAVREQPGGVPPIFREVVRGSARRGVGRGQATSELAQQLLPLPAPERDRVLLALVRDHAATVLGHADVSAIGEDQAFSDLGFDSLTAVELRNGLTAEAGVALSPTVVFDHPNPRRLAGHLAQRLLGVGGKTTVTSTRAAIHDDPIAIVGMDCRLPGAVGSPEDLWRMLEDGRDSIAPFPGDRGWVVDDLVAPDGTRNTLVGNFLDDVAGFDPAFFGISPREAAAMDPQQRLLLETSWRAVERSGINPASLRGSETGVFIGSNGQDYTALAVGDWEGADGYLSTATAGSVLSGRVSYVFGLEGPALTVD
ncbi:modular polyketide synthase, partial [Streptomyces antioxidans]